VHGENHRSATSHWQTLSHQVLSRVPGENHRSATSHWQACTPDQTGIKVII